MFDKPLGYIFYEFFSYLHVLLQVTECHLWFNHPEFNQMSSGLRFFGPECGAKTINLSKGHGVGFVIELSALGQIGLCIEILNAEKGGCSLTRRGSDYRGINQRKVVLIKKISYRFNQLVSYP